MTAIGHATMLIGRHAVGQRDHRQRLVRSRNRRDGHERVGSDGEAGRLADRRRRPRRGGCWSSTRRRRAEDGVAACRRARPTRRACSACRLKDRSAILPVGRGADAAYWWDTKTGSFVTSTYYFGERSRVGARRSTTRKPADAHAGASWTACSRRRRCAPAAAGRTRARRSTTRSTAARSATICCSSSPASCSTRERLGKRNATDLLSVSFSSNDSVGHTYGPDSPQVRDIARAGPTGRSAVC